MVTKNIFYNLNLVILLFFVDTITLADDFPGLGARNSWSEALPYYNLANKYLSHERYNEAIQNYQHAIELYDFDPDFHNNLGLALRKVDDFQGAEIEFKKAIKLKTNDWVSWSNLANAYLKQNKLESTIDCFQKALKLNPPETEKKAMLTDITDIQKILSMQKSSKPKEKLESNKEISLKSKQLNSKSKISAKEAKNKPNEKYKANKAILENRVEKNNDKIQNSKKINVSKEELQKSGWDYSY